ncbi:hypothetical protein EDD21DRAFT_405366 [Dissophora ornata]|nr:hypothetical protein BGZ58_000177 [Dissophora ornata]KAI8600281.1 hypothetical protein EDD21DRAFT_405366 [Dissophora ornata]
MVGIVVDAPSKKELIKAYAGIIMNPFSDKYEDKWEEDAYWAAVETFEARSKEIGYEDPFEVLEPVLFLESFEQIRESLIAGPPLSLRPGWKSPFIGAQVDAFSVVAPLEHLSGCKFSGEERIVVFEFWATWCGPCIADSPKVSDLAVKHAGHVAIIGINNESIFFKRPHDVEKIIEFLEKRKDNFRYTIYVDTPEGHAKEALYAKAGYVAIPCVVLAVDGIVAYARAPEENFQTTLQAALELTAPTEEYITI